MTTEPVDSLKELREHATFLAQNFSKSENTDLKTYIVWEAGTGNFWDTKTSFKATSPLRAALDWIVPGSQALLFELRVSCPEDSYRQWAVTLSRAAPHLGWMCQDREMQPVSWSVQCLLDQTVGILGPKGFDISYNAATLFSSEQGARKKIAELQAEERAWRISRGYPHADDDLNVFADPIPVYETDEFRRRSDTW